MHVFTLNESQCWRCHCSHAIFLYKLVLLISLLYLLLPISLPFVRSFVVKTFFLWRAFVYKPKMHTYIPWYEYVQMYVLTIAVCTRTCVNMYIHVCIIFMGCIPFAVADKSLLLKCNVT